MTQLTVQQALQLALQQQHAGHIQEAEQIYRQVLEAYPDQPDALHLLGVVACQARQFEEAEALVRRAISISPEPAYQVTLGAILQTTRRIDDAMQVYRDIIHARPDFPEAHMHLAVALSIAGRREEAVQHFQQALQLSPNHPLIQGNFGMTLNQLQRGKEAIPLLRSAVQQFPQNADFHSALAGALRQNHQFDEALEEARKAVALAPERGEPLLALAKVLIELGRTEEALPHVRRAAELLPNIDDVQILKNETLRRLGMADDMIASYRAALQQMPLSAPLRNNLGIALNNQALHDEAIAELRQANHLAPGNPAFFSNLLFAMLFHPTLSGDAFLSELQEYNRRHAQPLAPFDLFFPQSPDPARRLRIGYVSPDFRHHAVGLSLVPLFENHDKQSVELFCYADVPTEDSVTAHLRRFADHWIDTTLLSHEELAARVRQDQIDILVDLSLHLAGNRLPVFARKPAPVQISFAGYPGTTGVTTIDYRITDRYLEPEGSSDFLLPEQVLRLPDTFWCYFPRAEEVPVSPLPALAKGGGQISFGNLNNPAKTNPQTFALWAQVMQALPHSTITLLGPEGDYRRRTAAFFQHNGVSPARLRFLPFQQGRAYYEAYHHLDVILDSFPYNGHSTSLDALYMGVPVITLAPSPETFSDLGCRAPLARAGISQLTNLRLQELIATSPREFVQLAATLCGDLTLLSQLRSTLRNRMKVSPLMNGKRFAANIETAYRQAWKTWCAQAT